MDKNRLQFESGRLAAHVEAHGRRVTALERDRGAGPMGAEESRRRDEIERLEIERQEIEAEWQALHPGCRHATDAEVAALIAELDARRSGGGW